MKKTLSILLVLSLAISCALLLSGCKEKCPPHTDADKNGICEVCKEEIAPYDLHVSKYFNYVSQEDEDDVLGVAKHISALNGMDYNYNSSGNLLAFSNYSAEEGQNKYAVLNYETGNVVFTIKQESADSEIITSASFHGNHYGNGYIALIVETITENSSDELKYTTNIYDENGTKIATADKDTDPVQLNNKYMEFDGKVYIYEDDKFTFAFDAGLGDIPDFDYLTKDYAYEFGNYEFFVYDRNFAIVTGYEAPSNADESNFFVLNNGNVLIQNVIMLPADATDYQIFYDGEKYNLESFIFDVKTGAKTAVALDFIVGSVINEYVCSGYEEIGVDFSALANVIEIQKIENKAPARSEEYRNYSNDMKLLNYLGREIPMQYGMAQPIAENRYMAYDKSGKRYLIDENNKIIGEVTNASFNSDTKQFSCNGKYYDLDLKEVDSIDMSEYEVCSNNTYVDYTIYRKNTGTDDDPSYNYYIYRNGKMNDLNISGNVEGYFYCSYDYFYYSITTDGNKRYTIYANSLGEEIFKVETSATEYSSHYLVSTFIIEYNYYADGKYMTKYYVSSYK